MINFVDFFREGIHGVSHSINVFRIINKIIKHENIPDSESRNLLFCALFHDIGRTNDDIDTFHGIKSVKILERNSFFCETQFDNNLVRYIIENHCFHDDVGISNTNNYTSNQADKYIYFLKVFKDADGLDRIRLGDFNPCYLRLKSSIKCIDYARELNNNKTTMNDFYHILSSIISNNN